MKLNEVKSTYKFSCIYLWTNIINGKHYVGQTRNFYRRMYQYSRGRYNFYMNNAIKKYGIDNFDITILEKDIDFDNLDEREQYWLDYFQSYNPEKGYNICSVAGTTYGYRHTDEAKEKMSKIQKYRFKDPEFRLKFTGENNGMYGKKHSKEWRKNHSNYLKNQWKNEEYRKTQTERMLGENNPMFNVSLCGELNGMYGKHHSEETKEKISKAVTGKNLGNNYSSKQVICEETGVIYQSQSEAGREYGVTAGAISNACRGKAKTCCGLHWSFYID